MTFEEIKKELEAADTMEAKAAILKAHGAELSQAEMTELCNKPITKEQMEFIAAGNGAEAFYCCAWN